MASVYSQNLKDPRWQRKRLEIMQRDEFYCQSCFDDTNTLHVHHLIYRKGAAPWEYEDHELVTLCEDCHGGWHSVKDYIDRLCSAADCATGGLDDIALACGAALSVQPHVYGEIPFDAVRDMYDREMFDAIVKAIKRVRAKRLSVFKLVRKQKTTGES